MSEQQDKPITTTSSGSEAYKMVVYRSEDFQEVRSFDLTLGNIYVLSSVIMLILCGLIYSLIAFTPLKRFVPGYGKLESNHQFVQMIDLVEDLSMSIEAQGTYINALSSIINTGTSETPLQGLPDLDTHDHSDHNDDHRSQYDAVKSSSSASKKTPAVLTALPSEALYASLQNENIMLPAEGIISSRYDPAIKHFGVDIVAPTETPIVAMMEGTIFSSGWDPETGYSIGIQHKDGILTFYKHNARLLKEKGRQVKAGEAIAIIGNTGAESSGPHLHFEVWHQGKPINPSSILNL